MPIVKAMNDSNEAYYLEHGSYASNPQDLPVQGQSSYPTGTELEFGNNMDYAYVLATNASAKNNYIMYQKHSTNYPGEIHCEAITGDDLAEYICYVDKRAPGTVGRKNNYPGRRVKYAWIVICWKWNWRKF